jgi:diguanylate cyclase (GGDEF)-like protein
MSAQDSLFIALGILMLLFGLAWGLAGGLLGLSRQASLRWMGFCWSGGLAAAIGVFGHLMPPMVESGVRNLCIVLAFVLLRQGVRSFLRLPGRQAEHAMLLAATLAAPLAEGIGVLPAAWRSAAIAAVLCWLTLASGWVGAGRIRAEFGRLAATLVAGPMFATAALFGWRMSWALDIAVHDSVFPRANSIAPATLVALFTVAVMFNLALCYLVLMRLTRRLHRLALRDPLTQLLNRRALMDALQAEHLRLQRGGEGCALLSVDIDHFKRVNDMHGHAAGDEALRMLARVLANSVRENDVAARMGGEEFLLLRMTDNDGAMLAAQRIRTALASPQVGTLQPALRLTVSIGLLVLPRGATQPVEDWLLSVDAALYRAKELGRDRVEVAATADEAGACQPLPTAQALWPALR